MENVPLETRRFWAIGLQPLLANVQPATLPGQDDASLTTAITLAAYKANAAGEPPDDALLSVVIERESTIQNIILSTQQDPQSLTQRLYPDARSTNPNVPRVPAMGAQGMQRSDERERELAQVTLADALKVVHPTQDLRYVNLQSVETSAFLDTLAQASTNSAMLVCVGQEGSSINVIDHIIADNLASDKSFPDEELNQYTGNLYRIDLDGLILDMDKPDAPKVASVLRAAKQKLGALDEKSILLVDHLEVLEDKVEGRDPKDIEDFKREIAARGQTLVFGIFRAPDSKSNYLNEARLGHETVRPMPFKPYSPDETKSLIQRFYMPLWTNENRGFRFDKDAFDLLIKLEPGAWHDQAHKVLPGLAIAITQDAMRTAIRGEAQIVDTAKRALAAIAKVRTDEMPRANTRATFEPLLKLAEDQITQLITPQQGFMGIGNKPAPVTQDPNKPIQITSAHIVAELICPNRSEWHFPGFMPDAVRLRVSATMPPTSKA